MCRMLGMYAREWVGDGVEIAFDDQGHGPAVVLLHPFPFDARIWTDQVRALIEAGYRVIALDCPGFGDSPAPPAHLSIAELGELTRELLDRLDIATAVPIGLSMGGYVALAFAQQHPDRLRALVLADTRAAADGPAAREGRATALATIREQGVDTYLQGSLPRLLAADATAETLAHALSLAERRQQTLEAGIAALRDRPDRTTALAAIACPTLVVAGARDQVTSPAEMRAMAAEIPRSRYVEIARAGHLSNLEAPVEFNRAVLDFLRDASPPAGAKKR